MTIISKILEMRRTLEGIELKNLFLSLTIKTPKVYSEDEEALIKYASYASERESEDPIDNAILDYAESKSIKIDYSNRLFLSISHSLSSIFQAHHH